jgi:hypothetical protein
MTVTTGPKISSSCTWERGGEQAAQEKRKAASVVTTRRTRIRDHLVAGLDVGDDGGLDEVALVALAHTAAHQTTLLLAVLDVPHDPAAHKQVSTLQETLQ